LCEWSQAVNEQVRKTVIQAVAVHWLKRKVDFLQATLNINEHRNVARSVYYAARTLHLADKSGFCFYM
jgi:hypothetical protein